MDKKLGKLIADVWEDTALEDRLQADPHSVFVEYGVPVPAGKGAALSCGATVPTEPRIKHSPAVGSRPCVAGKMRARPYTPVYHYLN
jgi:hypothetical protein